MKSTLRLCVTWEDEEARVRRSVYVASSWRNTFQPGVVELLRSVGLAVYDFRHPTKRDGGLDTGRGFSWSEVDPEWKSWGARDTVAALTHPVARLGFDSDMQALSACTTCLMVLPCGRSAHLELGWAAGAGRRTAVYFPTPLSQGEPELMLAVAHNFIVGKDDLCSWALREREL